VVTAADLSVGTVTSANSATVPAISLMVSLGPRIVSVPNLIARPQGNAYAAIYAAGLTIVTVTTANSDTVIPGDVVIPREGRQSPMGPP
jgi:beta-lactam-binding protein with PASTA domain